MMVREKKTLVYLFFSAIFLTALWVLFQMGTVSAIDSSIATNTFPNPEATVDASGNKSDYPLYMTIGEGEFPIPYAVALIVVPSPGYYTLQIEDAGFCNNDSFYDERALDLPMSSNYSEGYFSTQFVVGGDDISPFTDQRAVRYTSYRNSCGASGNLEVGFRVYEKDVDKKNFNGSYRVNFFGMENLLAGGGHSLYNPTYRGVAPGAAENSFRIKVVGAKIYPTPTAVDSLAFSNRNRPVDSLLGYDLSFSMQCAAAPEATASFRFWDADYGIYQGAAYGLPALTYEGYVGDIGRNNQMVNPRAIFNPQPVELKGRNGEFDDILSSYVLKKDKSYQFSLRGLTYRNAISFRPSIDLVTPFVSSCSKPWEYQQTFDATKAKANTPYTEVAVGDVVNMSSTVENVGEVAGVDYTHKFQRKKNNGNWVESKSDGKQQLSAGETSPTFTDTFEIPASAAVGDVFCFRSQINPVAGTRDRSTDPDTINVTDPGPGRSNEQCSKVTTVPPKMWEYVHDSFDIMNGGVSAADKSFTRGQKIRLVGKIKNIGTGQGMQYGYRFQARKYGDPAMANIGGSAAYDNQPALNGGATSTQYDYQFYTIPDDAVIGKKICFRPWIGKYKGQSQPEKTDESDPAGRSGGALCITVENRPPTGVVSAQCIDNNSKVRITLNGVSDPDGGNVNADVTVQHRGGPSTVSGSGTGTIALEEDTFVANLGGTAATRSVSAMLTDDSGAQVTLPAVTYTCYPIPICEFNGLSMTTGQDFNLEVVLRNPSYAALSVAGGATYSIATSPVKNGIGVPSTLGYPVTIPANGTITIRSGSLKIDAMGSFLATWSITVYDAASPASVKVVGCGGNVDVSSKPYVRYFGNDVFAGGGYEGNCVVSSNTNAKANGLFIGGNAASNYKGSASELAVFAAGGIKGLLSGSQNTARQIAGLSFGNDTNVSVSSLDFGGGYGQPMCADDFPNTDGWSLATSITGNLDSLVSTANGNYQSIDGVTKHLGSNSIPNGKRVRMVVNGDVVISGNIVYSGASAGWGSIDDIPLVRIYATGNIYIDGNVTQLDGMYSAKGAIYTCTNGATPFNTDTPLTGANASAMIDKCKNKLTVNGAFIAPDVKLHRTMGNVMDSTAGEAATGPTSKAAEVFRFSPELYLALLSESTQTTNTGKFDSILSLPPAL